MFEPLPFHSLSVPPVKEIEGDSEEEEEYMEACEGGGTQVEDPLPTAGGSDASDTEEEVMETQDPDAGGGEGEPLFVRFLLSNAKMVSAITYQHIHVSINPCLSPP